MEPILSRGSKLALSMTGILVLTLSAAAGTYRLKKSAEIKRWEKELSAYSLQLKNENQLAKEKGLQEQ